MRPVRQALHAEWARVREAAMTAPAAERERLSEHGRRCADALVRLTDGTFGECLICQAPIALARLLTEPWVETCAVCAVTPVAMLEG